VRRVAPTKPVPPCSTAKSDEHGGDFELILLN
jgi:hypothetical protein